LNFVFPPKGRRDGEVALTPCPSISAKAGKPLLHRAPYFTYPLLRYTYLHQDSAIYYARQYAQPGFLVNFLKEGAGLYENIGQKDKALEALKASFVLKDSLNTARRTRIINELEQKYEKAKNENTIFQLKNQRRLLGLGLALLAGFCGLLYLVYRQKVLRQKQVILETEQRLNRSRMNPHFFFNALASLQSFALNESDSIVLAENLSMFSHIMRETLENTYREYNSVQQEIQFLDEYLKLQQLRFPDKFTYNIHSTIENSASVLIPSMIVQPFIENSIEHGFSDLVYAGHLEVTFDHKDNNTMIHISDNGRGLNNQHPKAKPYISRASQIIKDRIYLLNMKLKSNAAFKLENRTENKGVIVSITLPKIYEN
jgi:LytS/YehU family sensor histidine kinase